MTKNKVKLVIDEIYNQFELEIDALDWTYYRILDLIHDFDHDKLNRQVLTYQKASLNLMRNLFTHMNTANTLFPEENPPVT